MDKVFWKHLVLHKDYVPRINCPNCGIGLLDLFQEDIVHKMTKAGSIEHAEGNFESIQYVFSAILTCTNRMCKDVVSVTGNGSVEYVTYSNGYDESESEYVTYFHPKYFHPPINIIPCKPEYGKGINRLLMESFSVFFSDLGACANKIRQTVEEILTDQSIPRFVRSGKLKPLTLHSRIAKFNKLFPTKVEIGDSFLAVKFIGNSGSHVGVVDKDQVLDAYLILQHALDSIYVNPKLNKNVKLLAKRIIKKRGKK